MNDTAAKVVVFGGGALLIYHFAKRMNAIKANTGTAGGTGTAAGIGGTPGASALIAGTGGATGAGGTMGATAGAVGIADPTSAITLSTWATPVRIQNPDGTITEALAI